MRSSGTQTQTLEPHNPRPRCCAVALCVLLCVTLPASELRAAPPQGVPLAPGPTTAPTAPNGQQASEQVKMRVRLVDLQDFIGKAEPVQAEPAQAEPVAPLIALGPDVGTAIGPDSPCPVNGFHCIGCRNCAKRGMKGWKGAGPIPWEAFAQGEYIGPTRLAHVPEYRIRVDDILDFVFRLTRDASSEPYRMEVGDVIRIESLTAPELNQDTLVEPDGSISLRMVGQVRAFGLSFGALRTQLEEKYKAHVKAPSISISPVKISTRLDELRNSVDNRYGRGGQSTLSRVTPEGTVQLPAIGSVPAQGMTLDELQMEIEARYRKVVQGLGVTAILQQRAPRYVFVVGEVRAPGRYTLEGPTTLMQSIALAGGWNLGGNLNHVVVFRRDDNWNLMATKLNIFSALYGKEPCPGDEIWIRDSDIVVVPKRTIRVADDLIELYFTRGIYGVVPLNYSLYVNRLTNF